MSDHKFISQDGDEIIITLPHGLKHATDVTIESGIDIVFLSIPNAEIVLTGFTPGDDDGAENQEADSTEG